MEMNLEVNDWNDKFRKDYGIRIGNLKANGNRTRNQVVTKDGEFVNVVGGYYTIYPNELAKEIGKAVADNLDFEVMRELEQDSESRFTQTFIGDEEYDIDGNGDTVQLGFTIANSIDGERSLRVEGFNFRSICSNGLIMGKETLIGMQKRHTQQLEIDLDFIQDKAKELVAKMEDLVEAYRVLDTKQTNQEMAENLAKQGRLPKWSLPDYIEVETEPLKAKVRGTVSQWQTYNDVTETIWHNDGLKLDTKRTYFDELHKAMELPR